MDDSTTPRTGSTSPTAREGDAAWDEDFLYHLSRGSDLLISNRMVEAKEELERALAYRPQDAKGQDLLAGAYFRLGVYPRAIEIWSRLVRVHPDDVTLRVNLGLALLKTGQPDDALAHLARALELEPEHARAWGYVGLVQWRLGRLDAARDAFSRGGQISMARRMEELVASSPGDLAAPTSLPPPEPSDTQRAALRTTADAAIDRLTQETAPLVLEDAGEAARTREDRPSGQWKVVEAGTAPIPKTAQPRRPMPADAPMPLPGLLDWWAASIPPEQPLVVTASGALLLATKAALHSRAGTLRALRGQARKAVVQRRYRRGPDEVLGDDDPILRWDGDLFAMIGQRPGERFQALSIEEDLVYVVERYVQAFDDRVTFESGRLPVHAGADRLIQFRGTGTIVLRLPRPPTAIPVKSGEDVRVAPASLLGWTGRLFPVDAAAERRVAADDGATLGLRGDGTLLLV
jgi:hypothetical protein